MATYQEQLAAEIRVNGALATPPILYASKTAAQILALMTSKTRPAVTLTGQEVKSVVPGGVYDGLTDPKKAEFLSLVARDDLNPFGIDADIAVSIFGTPSDTILALDALRDSYQSRLEELGLKDPTLHQIEVAQ